MDVPAVDLNELNFKNNFESLLKAYEKENKGSKRKIWTKAKIEEVLNNIKHTRIAKTTGEKLKSMEYYWSAKYDSIVVNGQECITFKKKNPEDPTIRIIPREDFFDVLKPVHISCGHGGRDKMLKSIKNKFYMPKKAIEIFSSLCPVCGPKKNNGGDLKNSKNTRTLNSNDFNTIGVVEIIDFQSYPDGEFKWLLKYQDQATEFLNLRPLKSKDSKEISMELVKIFLTFGPPSVLQSPTGTECIDEILKELSVIWPGCKIMNGSSKLSNYQCISPQNFTNNNIVKMLLSWMIKNNIINWSVGCYFYQYYINSSSAYRTLFCREPVNILGGKNVSSTVLLLKGNVARKKVNRNHIPETETKRSITENLEHDIKLETENNIALESNNAMPLNEWEPQPLDTQMDYHELQDEIKIEFDDSEMYNQHNYDTEENSTNSNNAPELSGTKVDQNERKHSENSEICNENNEYSNNFEAKYTDSNTVRDEPNDFFDNNSKLFNLKVEPSEETDPLKNTCSICQNDMIVENTISCFYCSDNIHRACGISITYKGCDIKELCVKCAGKRVPELEEKVAIKGIKRAAEKTIDNTIAKRVLLPSSTSVAPGPSNDRRYKKHFLNFVGDANTKN